MTISPISLNKNTYPVNSKAQKETQQTIAEKNDNSALLYASLAAIGAAAIVSGGVLIAKAKNLDFITVLKKNNLILEKGSGLLKYNNGNVYTGVLNYKTKGNKYVREYKEGRLIMSGKNIDNTGEPLNKDIDYYKINYTFENGNLRQIDSVKRENKYTDYNTKTFFTLKEKEYQIKAALTNLEGKINNLSKQIKVVKKEKEELIESYELYKNKYKQIMSNLPEGVTIDSLTNAQKAELQTIITELENIRNKLKHYNELLDSLNRNVRNYMKELNIYNKELSKIIKARQTKSK